MLNDGAILAGGDKGVYRINEKKFTQITECKKVLDMCLLLDFCIAIANVEGVLILQKELQVHSNHFD